MKYKRVHTLVLTMIILIGLHPLSVSAYKYNDDYDMNYNTYNDDASYFKEDQPDVTNKALEWSAGSVSLKVGQQEDLAVGTKFNDLDNEISVAGSKSWSSDREEIATVTQLGVVTALRIGTAKISVTYSDNRANRITQTILVKVLSTSATLFAPAVNSFEVVEGKKTSLQELLFPASKDGAQNIKWSSSRPDILEVNSSGLVSAMRFGLGTITVTYSDSKGNGYTQTIPFKILSTEGDWQFKKINIAVKSGDSIDIAAIIYPDYRPVSYDDIKTTSSDLDIVSIGSENIITAKNVGTATITVEDKGNNVSDENTTRQIIQVQVIE